MQDASSLEAGAEGGVERPLSSWLRGLRGLDRIVAGAVLLGLVGLLIWLVSSFIHINIDSGDSGPYPTFGPDPGRRYVVVLLVYAAIWLRLTVQELRRSSVEASTASLGLCLVVGLIMAAGCAGLCLGLDCLNAWLDFSTPAHVPVLVQARRSEKRHTKYGAPHGVSIARVTRMDRPGPAFDVPWDSCRVPSPSVASPLATVKVGPGAFGIPWISLPVVCRPLTVADRPLATGVFLGRGAPVVLVTLEAPDAPEQTDQSTTVPKWIDAADRARPGVSTVLVYDGAVPGWASSVCVRNCQIVPIDVVDRDILAIFLKGDDSRQGEHLYVANSRGQRIFSAPLSDLGRRSECAKALAEAHE